MMTREAVASWVMSNKGAIDPQGIEDAVNELAASVTETVAKTKGVDFNDKWACAAITIEALDGTVTQAPAVTATTAVETSMPATASAEQMADIKKKLAMQRNERREISGSSQIKKVLFQKPDMKEYVPDGAAFTVSAEDLEKFKKAHPIDRIPAESQADYNKLLDLAASGAAIPARYTAMPGKVLGVVLESAVGAESETVMNVEEFKNFLTLKTLGSIPGNEHGIAGAKLASRTIKTKVDGTVAQTERKQIVVKFTDVKGAKEQGNFNLVMKVDNTQSCDIPVRSELCFKEYVYAKDHVGDPAYIKENKSGEKVTKTVRLSGKVTGHKLVWDPEYTDKFNDHKAGTTNRELPSDKEIQQNADLQAQAIAELLQKVHDGDCVAITLGSDFTTFLDAGKVEQAADNF